MMLNFFLTVSLTVSSSQFVYSYNCFITKHHKQKNGFLTNTKLIFEPTLSIVEMYSLASLCGLCFVHPSSESHYPIGLFLLVLTFYNSAIAHFYDPQYYFEILKHAIVKIYSFLHCKVYYYLL